MYIYFPKAFTTLALPSAPNPDRFARNKTLRAAFPKCKGQCRSLALCTAFSRRAAAASSVSPPARPSIISRPFKTNCRLAPAASLTRVKNCSISTSRYCANAIASAAATRFVTSIKSSTSCSASASSFPTTLMIGAPKYCRTIDESSEAPYPCSSAER